MLTSRIHSTRALGASALTPRPTPVTRNVRLSRFSAAAADTKESKASDKVPDKAPEDAASTTEKYGLEAGLYKVFTEKPAEGETPTVSRTQQAKDLLKKYGSAYLITSISFAIVSFSLCYLAVDNGVDIAALLAKIGLTPSSKSETVGTFAIAYAAHKALSPVRFPPTVALTPVVAKLLNKEVQEDKVDTEEKKSE